MCHEVRLIERAVATKKMQALVKACVLDHNGHLVVHWAEGCVPVAPPSWTSDIRLWKYFWPDEGDACEDQFPPKCKHFGVGAS